MSAAKSSTVLTENRLLKALAKDERSRLISESTEVHLNRRTILYRAGETVKFCYFPLSGMISLLSAAGNGKSVIIGIVGNEGIAGVSALFDPPIAPYEVTAQIETAALRIKADVLRKEFERGGKFQRLIMGYLQQLLFQISQSAVCHRFHTVEQRFACWLLISADRAHSNEFSLRQECISQMLGVPRTNVSMTANPLQERGAISYHYGKIRIVDRLKLERAACECYHNLKPELGVTYP
jgi:CRP-like cAMP-binding protein